MDTLKTNLMVFPVFIRTHCGTGRFCFIFFANFILILNVLWAACNSNKRIKLAGATTRFTVREMLCQHNQLANYTLRSFYSTANSCMRSNNSERLSKTVITQHNELSRNRNFVFLETQPNRTR